jgi:ABC-type lipoprotein export system ATPase subunit
VAPLVDARELFAVYPPPAGGVAALRGLTFSVAERELCVVLGPSGSGKTTLMHMLAGLERPAAGTVVVAGLDLGRASGGQLADHRSHVLGYADQHYWRALAGELTAEQLVGVPLGLSATNARERLSRAHELLERVGLLDRAKARPGELSGGEQQRIALCAALAHRPRLLLADEPTGELDAETADGVHELIRELVVEHGATAVVVSHDPASTEIADRVVHIRDGRVSEERQGAKEMVVVGTGGWLRVPEEVLRAAGIRDRAVLESNDGTVQLRAAETGDVFPEQVPAAAIGVRGRQLEARAVSRRYGEHAVFEDLDARFSPGELAVVTGPSGSGKSTLFALLAGLDLPDEGDVVLGDTVISSLDRSARAALRSSEIAVVGQAAGLLDYLTATENIELSLALRGTEGVDAAERSAEALAAVGLAEHANRQAGVLSAGQRERVALARAFAARTPVVLADEPTARLDGAATVSIGRLLAELAHEYGSTVVCATHDPLLIELSDRDVRLRERVAVASA